MTVPQDNTKWRKSSLTESQGACVELHPSGVVRDSKDPDGPRLKLSFAGLVSAVKADSLTR